MSPDQIRLLGDARLSDTARIVGLHISALGEGEHEISHDSLAAVLHGCPNADTVGRHIRQLIVFQYIERTSAGGKGSPRYRWSAREKTRVEEIATLENSRAESLPSKIHGESPLLPAKIHGQNGSPSSPPYTPPTPSPTAGARPPDKDLDRLAMYLGEHAGAVHRMIDSADHGPSWAAAIYGKYGPGGTMTGTAFAGIPTARIPAVVATALIEWTTTGKPFRNQHFDGFMRKAVANERRSERDGSDGGGSGAAVGRPAFRAVGGGRGSWDIEE